MTNGANEAAGSRKVIYATCSLHGGPAGFTNVVLRKLDGEIELDPHVTGACVLRFAEDEAVQAVDAHRRQTDHAGQPARSGPGLPWLPR